MARLSHDQVNHPVDIHVGLRIKARRTSVSLSARGLAEMIGVTEGQLQKYESGVNRLTAGRISDIARALEVPVAWLFEGYLASAAVGENLPSPSLYSAANLGILTALDTLTASQQRAIRDLIDEFAKANTDGAARTPARRSD
jgi:transcriptional regulator with XRE-family HTH domain